MMPLPVQQIPPRRGSRYSTFATYLRRIIKPRQMDLEFTFWLMLQLCLSPKTAYRYTSYHKQTKNQWARDDPAFVVVTCALVTVTALAYCVTFGVSIRSTLFAIIDSVIVDYLVFGCLMATAYTVIANSFLTKKAQSYKVEQTVEWLYAFDVHCNSFFPLFLLLYVLQFLLTPLLLWRSFLANALSCALYAGSLAYYHYLNFLGFSALPFLEHTEVFLWPIALIFLCVPFAVLTGFNPTRMKFNQLLAFNSVPEWKDHYVHYAHYKKFIYEIARLEQQAKDLRDGGPSPDLGATEPLLLQRTASVRLSGIQAQIGAKESELVKEMDKELGEIIEFFSKKEGETVGRLPGLDLEVHSLEKTRPGSLSGAAGLAVLEDGLVSPRLVSGAGNTPPTPDAGPAIPLADGGQRRAVSIDLGAPQDALTKQYSRIGGETPRTLRVRFWADVSRHPAMRELRAERERLRLRFVDIYTTLNDLIEYLHLNREGFRKVCKKHDKLTSTVSLMATHWPLVEAQYPMSRKAGLEAAQEQLVELYALVYTAGDSHRAKDLLSRNLREHIKVERGTVWRDMVALERKRAAATVEPVQPVTKPAWWKRHQGTLFLLSSVLAFVTILSLDLFPGEPEKHNCLALLVFASALWALEAIPLYATAMLVPVLIVLLRVLVDRSQPDAPRRLTPQEAAPAIFHTMFSQVIMLLLGGFTIAAALSKHFIAKQMAVAVLSRVGRQPHNVLLASMFVATFASMWISNVAAPVLCFSLVQPILRTMDVTTPFAKSLVMGIALASNVGGMTSPISSPQNIFAIERMSMDGHPPSWLAWFAVALPVAAISNVLCWGVLLVVYKPWTQTTEVRPLKRSTDPMSFTQVYVVVVSIVTVGLWCANSLLQPYVGEMGVVAVLPMIAFFGFGVLNKDDFNGFLWNVVMLAMGGSALGEAVKSSGLLQTIAEAIKHGVEGMDLWQVTAVFCGVVLCATTFISHTVGAMVILPIVQSVGDAMPSPHPKLLVMAAALTCSAAMGLPVSGFPNMNAVSLEDGTGQTYVAAGDFLVSGVPSSVAACGVILSVGYTLMRAIGF